MVFSAKTTLSVVLGLSGSTGVSGCSGSSLGGNSTSGESEEQALKVKSDKKATAIKKYFFILVLDYGCPPSPTRTIIKPRNVELQCYHVLDEGPEKT